MSCTCRNTVSKVYKIVRTAAGKYQVSGPGAATSCGGTLNVVPPSGYDCIRLTFKYEAAGGSSNDILLPLISTGTCPCETDSDDDGAIQVFVGKFEIPTEVASCSYLWTLKPEQPPCRIDIVIHAP